MSDLFDIGDLDINHYDYELPENRIAQHPLAQRDQSKLLVCRNNIIQSDQFSNLSSYLDSNSLVIRNKTKVIYGRFHFRKESGASIEIFCLEPVSPTTDFQVALSNTSGVSWNCLIGNSRKWKSGIIQTEFKIDGQKVQLVAKRTGRQIDHSEIYFTWTPKHLRFSEILTNAGVVPLPPYVKRGAEENDKIRYQTIYAKEEGSVAAPTAGLHFTKKVFMSLFNKQINFSDVTLHVGAGTFKPVTASRISEHKMHTEKVFIERDTIESILLNLKKNIVITGTTTMRTIESLYWHGVKVLQKRAEPDKISINQWDPYNEEDKREQITTEESLAGLLRKLDEKKVQSVSGQTQLMIVPGYNFRIADVLITNFHMPKSTLLLLVSAFIGEKWKDVYQYALENSFRFLSYGDPCLFFKSGQ
ncbi:MAG: S-adenosylmethionine:tRNA ribosyltransferase-isomerase [Bacteroidales bacterium]|nr:S-adenosylmethionine:tRNA ribosyltransferase-isomerase [Bacteroidales bacterium]